MTNDATHYAVEASYNDMLRSVERREFNLVATLGLSPFPEGDLWCVLWGEDLMTGVSGFGPTPVEAVLCFNRAVASERCAK